MAMTQEQFQAIQLQLASSEQQVLTLSNMIDKVRSEASNAVRELREGLAAKIAKRTLLQQAASNGGGHSAREWRIVSSKEFGGGRFHGAKAESIKVWSKKAKIFLNIKKNCFKRMLEAVENNEKNHVDDRTIANMGLAWGTTT